MKILNKNPSFRILSKIVNCHYRSLPSCILHGSPRPSHASVNIRNLHEQRDRALDFELPPFFYDYNSKQLANIGKKERVVGQSFPWWSIPSLRISKNEWNRILQKKNFSQGFCSSQWVQNWQTFDIINRHFDILIN